MVANMLILLALLAGAQAGVQESSLTIIHSFDGDNGGGGPIATPMYAPDGFIYGTTAGGGNYKSGTVWQLGSNNMVSVIAHLNNTYGSFPFGGVIYDYDGSLYGTGQFGGAFDKGALFKIDASNTISVVHSFSGMPDGQQPTMLVRGGDGYMYGSCGNGGTFNDGFVFRFRPGKPLEKIYAGTNQNDWHFPTALVFSDGSMRENHVIGGTTLYGCTDDVGAIWIMSLSSPHSVKTVCVSKEHLAYPLDIIVGNNTQHELLGASEYDLFSIDRTHGFVPKSIKHYDNPHVTPYGITMGTDGYIYGTTAPFNTSTPTNSCGTLFRVSPTGSDYEVLHSFKGQSEEDGCYPKSAPIELTPGVFLGTTYEGGEYNAGTIYTYVVERLS